MHRAKNTPWRENRAWGLVSMAQNEDLEQHWPGRAAWHESLCFLCRFSSSVEQTTATFAVCVAQLWNPGSGRRWELWRNQHGPGGRRPLLALGKSPVCDRPFPG